MAITTPAGQADKQSSQVSNASKHSQGREINKQGSSLFDRGHHQFSVGGNHFSQQMNGWLNLKLRLKGNVGSFCALLKEYFNFAIRYPRGFEEANKNNFDAVFCDC